MLPSFHHRHILCHANIRRAGYRAVVFDFDGTLSLIREGWARIMAELGRDLIQEQKLPCEAVVLTVLETAMLRLSGKPSIFQMRKLAEEVKNRGGVPGNPEEYLLEFHKRLFSTVTSRRDNLRRGSDTPQTWTVPGAHELLQGLAQRGVPMALASGTDLSYVKEELKLLQMEHFFGSHVYAPAGDLAPFHKKEAIQHFLHTLNVPPTALLSLGDGYSETVEVKAMGGTAVGVAGREAGLSGWNLLKREMLQELGAELLITDYHPPQELLQFFGWE